MKKLFFIIILVSLSANVFAGEYSKEYLEKKLYKFQKMKTTGIVFTLVGLPMAVIGTPMYFNEANKQDVNDVELGKFLGGGVLMIVGELMIVGGVVMWAFGNSRIKRYKGLLKQKEYGLNFGLNKKGIGFQYKF